MIDQEVVCRFQSYHTVVRSQPQRLTFLFKLHETVSAMGHDEVKHSIAVSIHENDIMFLFTPINTNECGHRNLLRNVGGLIGGRDDCIPITAFVMQPAFDSDTRNAWGTVLTRCSQRSVNTVLWSQASCR